MDGSLTDQLLGALGVRSQASFGFRTSLNMHVRVTTYKIDSEIARRFGHKR